MAKSQRGRRTTPVNPALSGFAQQGLRHFQAGRLDAAIDTWSALAATNPQVQSALAEALFRRALKQPAYATEAIADLRQALELAPGEARYSYHLGMRLHQAGDLDGARAAYEAVIAADGPQGAALLLAIVALEDRPRADLAKLPGSTAEIVTLLAPLQALLRGAQPTAAQLAAAEPILRRRYDASAAGALLTFWQGLGEVQQGDPAALATLTDQRTLPTPGLIALRRFYQGVAAAHDGDDAGAAERWFKVAESGQATAALAQNLTAALYEQLTTLVAADQPAAAAKLALQSLTMRLAPAPALDELRVQVLDQAAHAAAAAAQWRQAADYWEGARLIVGASTGLGSPRPLWHNLALAYEAQEGWESAADAWRGMLRTRPRRGGKTEDALSEAQWAWVRARVIECYRRAGRPDEAVTVYRQMIKAEPNDLHLRLELADALLANEQEQAAYNEVQRILKLDPNFVEARLRSAAFHSARGYWQQAEQELRALARQHPDREDVRFAFARLLLEHAARYIGGDRRQNQHAQNLLEEGFPFEPANPEFPLNLARVRFNLGDRPGAQAHLERALELAGDRLEIYAEAYNAWLLEKDLAAAGAVIERAGAHNPPPEFYVDMGMRAIKATADGPDEINPFLDLTPRKQRVQPEHDPAWMQFGEALIARGLAQRPNDAMLHGAVAAGLMGIANEVALAHTERAVALAPEQPEPQIILAMSLALAERKREAKEQLRKTAAMARKRGMLDAAREADALRQQVDSPFFASMVRMQMQSALDPDDLLDEFEDFF
jgi:pentatricopeptide repeat protein